MREFGGFLPLEQTYREGRGPWYRGALELATGRSCLTVVLRHVLPRRVHLPFYICNSVIDTVLSHGAEICYYALDKKLLPADKPAPLADELFVIVNYFGIRGRAVDEIAGSLQERCFVDNTQAFFEAPTVGAWTCYSARKFFGVPDGAYLYAPVSIDTGNLPESKSSVSHLRERLLGHRDAAYRAFLQYEESLDCEPRRTSVVSHELLQSIDYEEVRSRRVANARQLHERLGNYNKLSESLTLGAAPLCYPLLLPRNMDRQLLASQLLFVPRYWQEVFDRAAEGAFGWEKMLASLLVALPVDHRYTKEDMDVIAERVVKNIDLGR